jgi:hypothetical protein
VRAIRQFERPLVGLLDAHIVLYELSAWLADAFGAEGGSSF